MSIKSYLITLLMFLCFIQVHESVAMLARMSRITRYSYVNARQSELPLKKEATDALVDTFAKECDISESVLKEAENIYSVEWREIERNYDNQVLGEAHYKALISVIQIPHTNEDQYRENPLNPFGLYVTSLSWSKLM